MAEERVLLVAAGEYSSAAASEHFIFGWGSKDFSTVGNLDGDASAPRRVAGPVASGNWTIRALAAGYQHVMAIATPPPGMDTAALAALAQENPQPEKVKAKPKEVGDGVTTKGISNMYENKAAEQQAPQEEVKGANVANSTSASSSSPPVTSTTSDSNNNTSAIVSANATTTPADGGADKGANASASSASLSNATGVSPADAGAGAGVPAGDFHSRYLAEQLKERVTLSVSEYWEQYKPSPAREKFAGMFPDIFEGLPSHFNSSYKNPCWFDSPSLASSNATIAALIASAGASASTDPDANVRRLLLDKPYVPGTHPPAQVLKCLPYFQILGVSKCGTTDLYHRLSMHEDIYEANNKGPHWWDECVYPPRGSCTAPPSGDFFGYVHLYSRAAAAIEKKPDRGICSEASSNTYTSARGVYMRGRRRKTSLTISELLRDALPFQRNIVMFRDPVQRYFSAFYYYRWWQKDQPPPGPEDFHKRAVQEVETWRSCEKQRGRAACVRLYEPQQLVKGMYSEFIEDWLSKWPRSQLLFIRNEDYAVAAKEHLAAVFKFLDVREPSGTEWEDILEMKAKNKSRQKRREMLPETKALLEEFYRPFNEALAKALGDDRFLWKDGSESPL